MPPLFCINISGFRHTSGAKPDFSRIPAGYEKDALSKRLFNQNGGQSGIRTHGTLWGYTRFPIVHLRPLGHLSVAPLCITFFYIWQALFLLVRKNPGANSNRNRHLTFRITDNLIHNHKLIPIQTQFIFKLIFVNITADNRIQSLTRCI